jgi:hypothetical protein
LNEIGGASGVDEAAEEQARMLGLSPLSIRPDWNTHGRAAGILRNKTIVDQADKVVAFWDGKSRGTRHTIGYGYGARETAGRFPGLSCRVGM